MRRMTTILVTMTGINVAALAISLLVIRPMMQSQAGDTPWAQQVQQSHAVQANVRVDGSADFADLDASGDEADRVQRSPTNGARSSSSDAQASSGTADDASHWKQQMIRGDASSPKPQMARVADSLEPRRVIDPRPIDHRLARQASDHHHAAMVHDRALADPTQSTRQRRWIRLGSHRSDANASAAAQSPGPTSSPGDWQAGSLSHQVTALGAASRSEAEAWRPSSPPPSASPSKPPASPSSGSTGSSQSTASSKSNTSSESTASSKSNTWSHWTDVQPAAEQADYRSLQAQLKDMARALDRLNAKLLDSANRSASQLSEAPSASQASSQTHDPMTPIRH